MCGIFGIARHPASGVIDRHKVREAAMLMKHRGPDAYGQWGIADAVEFAHLRLAIIDLSPESNQPFLSGCGQYAVVFNGEIYNYIEIRKELESLGYKFRTSSDTEVLLNSYIAWGSNCVSRFNGDWAFAIYNVKEDLLFCSRDRFGVKPFNYAIVDNQFIFSSEIKSIISYFPVLRRPNYNVIANFCRNGLGAQHEHSWFEGIKRLLPAHNLIWQRGEMRKEKYWEYPTHTIQGISLEDAKVAYRELFLKSVELRMRSDVPIGTTLSSGIDSGSIVSVIRKYHGGAHKTFTATFKKQDLTRQEKNAYRYDLEINEADLVNRLADDLDLDARMAESESGEFVSDLEKNIYHLESGHSSPATVPLSKILHVAREHVTVVMEGQGADELLGGYIVNVFPALVYECIRRGELRQAWREFIEFRRHYSLGYMGKLFVRLLNNSWLERIYYTVSGIDRIFGPHLARYSRLAEYPQSLPEFSERFNKGLCKSHSGGLVNLLHYGDAISMANSLESRLPFMDVDLVEYVFRLQHSFKVRDGLGKYIHRCAMAGILPDYILKNPIKMGFNTPVAKHFKSIDSQANKLLLSEKCLGRGLFERAGLYAAIRDQIDDRRDNSTLLFRLLSTELWFRQFIDGEVVT